MYYSSMADTDILIDLHNITDFLLECLLTLYRYCHLVAKATLGISNFLNFLDFRDRDKYVFNKAASIILFYKYNI